MRSVALQSPPPAGRARRHALRTLGVALLAASAHSVDAAPVRDAPELLREVRVAARTLPDTLTVGDRVTLEIDVEVPAGWQVRFPDRLQAGGAAELVNVQVAPPGAKRAAKSGRAAPAAGRSGSATLDRALHARRLRGG